MNDKEQCQTAIDILKANITNKKVDWLAKNARGVHNGMGVSLLYDETIADWLNYWENGDLCSDRLDDDEGYVIQMFVDKPFLIDGRKFDFRVFLAILSTDPLMVMVRDIYIKMSS